MKTQYAWFFLSVVILAVLLCLFMSTPYPNAFLRLHEEETSLNVIDRMQRYERGARYDNAIEIGTKWTDDHPNDGSNDLVFREIAIAYLEEAKRGGNKDELVGNAILYRDKLLTSVAGTSDWRGMAGVRDAALISESAADLFNNDNHRDLPPVFSPRIMRLSPRFVRPAPQTA